MKSGFGPSCLAIDLTARGMLLLQIMPAFITRRAIPRTVLTRRGWSA